MSDSGNDTHNTGVPPRRPLPAIPEPSDLPSLEILALAQVLADQPAATGHVVRLSDLIGARSDAIGPLTDAALAHLADLAYLAQYDEADGPGDSAEDGAEDDDVTAGARHVQLSPGTQRGLESVFGRHDASPGATYRVGRDEDVSLVAEAPAVYGALDGNTERSPAPEAVRVLGLARQCGFDAETLAVQVMLSPDAIRWLDHVALVPEHQPDALVVHLAGALEVERDRVRAALANGEIAVEPSPVIGMLLATDDLTPLQRDYWRGIL